MDKIIADTKSAVSNCIASALMFSIFCAVSMYYAYYGDSALECSICTVVAVFHARLALNSLSWVNYMKNQLTWVQEHKSTYPVEAPKNLSIKSLLNSLSSVVW